MSDATRFVLWGSHARYAGGTPIKLTGGSLQHCNWEQRGREQEGGWTLAIYREGTAPTGPRMMIVAA